MKHRAASLRQHICLYLNDLFSVIILSLILIKLGVNDMKARAVCIVKPAETAVASSLLLMILFSILYMNLEIRFYTRFMLYALSLCLSQFVCLFVCLYDFFDSSINKYSNKNLGFLLEQEHLS